MGRIRTLRSRRLTPAEIDEVRALTAGGDLGVAAAAARMATLMYGAPCVEVWVDPRSANMLHVTLAHGSRLEGRILVDPEG